MKKYTQKDAPLYAALNEHKLNRIVHFDVPGHKGGRGNKELTQFLGQDCLKVDVNSMKPLDNLCHPVSVIKESQALAAEAFGADDAFFMVNGTTSAVQAMIMSCCKPGDKIIMPRNVHRSAINTLVICGAVPVYINPGINTRLGISLGMSISDLKDAICKNPDAKAIFINNPTYYGICSNISEIVSLAHEHGMKVLADEAHGTHLYFADDLPAPAMTAGADMSAISMHKTGGSLTQSSILLTGANIDADYVRQIINLTQTTSSSYLLLSSLDIARKNLSLNGRGIFNKTIKYAQYARDEINKIVGYYAYSTELIDGDSVFDFDKTKLSVYTRELGLAGIEVYDILRDEYGIQIEFGDIGNILAIISAGDGEQEIERLISALSEIKRLYKKEKIGMLSYEYINPELILTPQKAFYSAKRQVPINQSVGRVSAEFVMSYPPGIPILAPGELITKDIVNYIEYAKEKNCLLTGTRDMEVNNICIVEDM